jgi:hypothetical protein
VDHGTCCMLTIAQYARGIKLVSRVFWQLSIWRVLALPRARRIVTSGGQGLDLAIQGERATMAGEGMSPGVWVGAGLDWQCALRETVSQNWNSICPGQRAVVLLRSWLQSP